MLKELVIDRRVRYSSKLICKRSSGITLNATRRLDYIDHGWLRPAIIPTREQLTGVAGRLHRFADHNIDVPPDHEVRGISNGDLRVYLKLPIGRIPFAKHSPEHGRARTISGCLRTQVP